VALMIGNIFGDAWDLLTGKPQSWYTKVSGIQNQLAVVMAGVTSAGSELWNLVSQSAEGPSLSSTPASGVDDFDSVLADLDKNITAIVVTKSHVPTDEAIAQAQAAANKYQGQLNFVTSVSPEMADQIRYDQAQVQAQLPSAMTSPSGVAKEVFFQTLDDRAKALGAGTMDLIMYGALGLAAVALLNFLGTFK
jgi:hypothetical protein